MPACTPDTDPQLADFIFSEVAAPSVVYYGQLLICLHHPAAGNMNFAGDGGGGRALPGCYEENSLLQFLQFYISVLYSDKLPGIAALISASGRTGKVTVSYTA
jgi:hypothetical protein